MKFTRQVANFFIGRRGHSLLCLVAALLLQSPIITALVIASGACCSGDHCPVAAHHHAAAKTEEMPMDCDHNLDHDRDRLRSCSMSCCNTAEPSAIHSNVFLVGPVIEPVSLVSLAETVSAFAASETASRFPPLSPPPKSFHLI